MIRIDMSEYMEKHSVSRLIGAPPGYIGYDEGGQLTEAVRRKPYSIILLDEIEKAHDDVFNILLQILEDGRLTDNQGRTVSFKNTIIIMTSNIQKDLVKSKFKPEFLNRIDDIIEFKGLGHDELKKITQLLIADINKVLADREISFELDNSAMEKVIKESFDTEYGARPVRRYLEKKIETLLAVSILNGTVTAPSKSVVTVEQGLFKLKTLK